MTGPPDWIKDIAPGPPPKETGPLERPVPRMKKPPQPIRARKTERMKVRNAETFGVQAALCRKRPCLVRGCRTYPSVPAHVLSRGAGGVDRHCVPLCWPHHQEAHDHGHVTFGERYGLDLECEAANLAAELAARATHDCEENAELLEHEPSLSSRYVCRRCGYVLPDEQEGARV